MRIALDAMGTDQAPASEVEGAVAAVREDPELHVLLVGDEAVVAEHLEGQSPQSRISVVHAPDRVTSADGPASAVRRRPRSSMSVALHLHDEGKADAFVSAGPTGAVMAGSLLALGALPGVDRPTVATLLPTSRGAVLLVDAGANIECKPRHLVQFARLGTVYMQDLHGIGAPRVGLLNVGSEAVKGTEVVQEAHRRLERSGLNFVGNVEGRDIIHTACDVLVCDGFVGNVLLKFYESVAGFLVDNLRSRLGDRRLEPAVEEVFRVLDYEEYGGAPLLGVDGVTVICHGSSSSRAIRAALGVASGAVRSGVASHIARELLAARREEPQA